jgi:hypothetical protein
MSMVWIAGSTLGSAGSFSFSSIPTGFAHLQIRLSYRSTASATSDGFIMRFNSDSSDLYVNHRLSGDGSTATSGVQASIPWNSMRWPIGVANTATANVFGSAVIDILDANNTNKNTTVRALCGWDNNGSGVVGLVSGFYMATPAISAIQIFPLSVNDFVSGSRCDLYGFTTSSATGA